MRVEFECSPLQARSLIAVYAMLTYDDLLDSGSAIEELSFIRHCLTEMIDGEYLPERSLRTLKNEFSILHKLEETGEER